MESSTFIPSCRIRIGTSHWEKVHEIPSTSLIGKIKQYNKQYEVVPVGDEQQETSLMPLQFITLVVP